MAINKDDIRLLLDALEFTLLNGTQEIWEKKYRQHNDYFIQINFEEEKILYNTRNEDSILVHNNTTTNFSSDENFVVLECINRLLGKGYAPQNIEIEKSWPSGHGTSGRLDILVKKEQSSYLMLECKTFGKAFEKEKQNMLTPNKAGESKGQLFAYAFEEKTTEYICLYASKLENNEVLYENLIVPIDESWKKLSNKKELFDYWNKSFKKNGIFEDQITPYNIECKALLRSDLEKITAEDSSRIFNQFLEILRHNAVSDKPNAFNKILNLFICKIIDEDRSEDEELLFQWKDDSTFIELQSNLEDLYKKGMERFLDIEITDYSDDEIEKSLILLNDSKTKELIKKMFLDLRLHKNSEFAFKEVYNNESFEENAKVLKEVVELLQPYQFRYGHKQQFLGNFFELLLNTSIKQESGQFFTPVPIARFMITSLPIQTVIEDNIKNNSKELLPRVIDYACGSGHFLTEYMDIVQTIINNLDTKSLKKSQRNTIEKWKQFEDENAVQGEFEWAKDYVYGVEKDYRLVKTTKISTFLNGDGEANIIHADGLDKFSSEKYKGLLNSNNTENENFDFVVANPPYSVLSFKQSLPSDGNDFETFSFLTENSSEIECLFVERTKQLLKPNGFAAIILPSSILSNTDNLAEKTREILLKNFYLKAVAKMGPKTFMATGTNTVILFLQKRPISESLLIEKLILEFFNTYKDFSYNKTPNVIGKYVSENFDNISYADYITYLRNTPVEKIINLELYQDLFNSFNKSKILSDLKKSKEFKALNENDKKVEISNLFKQFIFNFEYKKIFYYLLCLKNQTLVINSGEKDEEKAFLGYEFSNRRRYEGLHPFTDENGYIDSSLYDEQDINGNPNKVNYYINQAFNNNYPDISEKLQKNIKLVSTSSLFELQDSTFSNTIYIKPRRFVLESKFPQVKIGKLVTMPIARGKTTKYGKSGIQIIKSGQIRGGTEFDFGEKFYTIDSFQSDERNLKKGDLLMNSTGVGTAGRVNLFNLEGEFVVDSHVSIIRLDNKVVYPEYVLYALNAIGFKNIESLAQGQSGQIELSASIISNIKIPVPPLEIQKNIIDESYSIAEKISILKDAIIEIESEQNGEINDIFANNYPMKNLGDTSIVELKRGPFGGSLKKEIFVASGYKVYEQKHAINNDFTIGRYYVTEEKYKEMEAFSVLENDIIMSCSGTIGKFAIAPSTAEPGIINQALLRFRATSKIQPLYLKYCLEHITNEFQNKSHGQGLQNITSVESLKKIKIPVPEDLIEQSNIIEKIQDIYTTLELKNTEISKLQNQYLELTKKYL